MAKAVAIQNPLVQAFLDTWDERMAYLLANTPDKIPLLVDTCSADVLPILAAQFDVLGYNGWKLATTEQQRRDLIKRAIEMHRHRGTPYSLRQALEAVGFFSADIEECIAASYNGMLVFKGQTTYGSLNWAHFGVLVDLGTDSTIDIGQNADLVAMIRANKNARSLLVKLDYGTSFSDDIELIEDLDYSVEGDYEEPTLSDARYDGVFSFSGSVLYVGSIDTFSMTAYYDNGTITQITL